MPYKRFTVKIIIRIVLLTGNVLVISWIFGDMRLFFNQVILATILTAQIAELIHFVNHTNRELSRLFLAIKHSDFSISFKHAPLGRSFEELQSSLTEIMQAYREVKIEKEAQYHFLQMLVKQIHVGIVSLAGEQITMINPTAEKLLNIEGLKNWKLVLQLNPALANQFEQLGDNGRKLMEIRSATETRVLAVDVSTSLILDKPYTLITIQDINSEIEQKEIEAWHKLIRILTHEIMNSVTPISSLTETMQGMLTDNHGQQKELNALDTEILADIRFSLNTIQKRSEGLLNFVENYRKLTRVPKPVMEPVNIKVFLQHIEKLMKPELLRQNIILYTIVDNDALNLSIDPKLIEQVLINLIANSTHALQNRENKTIHLKAYTKEHHTIIEVTDNGKGIPEKELQEIFVPFFSTKTEGSGIGLSLSKQIMSLHHARIKVSSTPNQGTSLYLQFQNHK